jgi:cyclase
MEIIRHGSAFSAFIRPEEGANVGLIHTPRGMVLIDTTSSRTEIQALLDDVAINVNEIHLVINTHSHSDHTWGNQLFRCPILAHRICRERMQSVLDGEWSSTTLHSYLADLEKSDPEKAKDFRQVLEDLVIKIPDRIFEYRFEGELGDVKYEVNHYGGHSPDLSVVWLPERKVLYASDLIFQGRYPYIFDADIPTWINALDRLPEYQVDLIIPGHGVSCSVTEIMRLRSYLLDNWERVKDHIRLGHNLEQTLADPGFSAFPGEKYERFHLANIRFIYQKLTS